MKKTLLAAALALALGLAATASQAALTLGFQPSAQTKFLGEAATVDLVLSGLGTEQQVVSAYDFDVTYDDTILDLLFVQLTANLGTPSDSLFGVNFQTGRVNIFEVSLLSDSDLDALQGDSVVLATLGFLGAALGTSPLTFENVIMDGYQLQGSSPALPVVLQPTLQGGSITIIQNGNVIPEPGTLALVAFALAGATALRRRRG